MVIALLACCCCFTLDAQVQDTYFNGLDHDHYSIINSSSSTTNRVMAGTLDTPSGKDIHVMEVDVAGNIVWETVYESGSDDRAFHILSVGNNGYLIVGLTVANGQENALAVLVDLSGNLLASQMYPDLVMGIGSRFLHASEVTDDPSGMGGFIATGWVGGSDEPSPKKAWVVRIDPSLSPMWTREYDSPVNSNNDFDMGSNIIEAKGKGFFLTGSSNPSNGLVQLVLASAIDYGNNLLWQTSYSDTNGSGHYAAGASALYEDATETVFQLANFSIIHHFGVNVFDFNTGIRDVPNSWEVFSQFGYANIQGFRLMESLSDPNNLVVSGYMRDHNWMVDDPASPGGTVMEFGSVPFLMEIPKYPGAIIAGGGNPVIWDRLYEVPSPGYNVSADIYDAFSAGQQPRIFHPEMAEGKSTGDGYVINAYRSPAAGNPFDLEFIETDLGGNNLCSSAPLNFINANANWFDYPVVTTMPNGTQPFAAPLTQLAYPHGDEPCNGGGGNDPCELNPVIDYVQIDCYDYEFFGTNNGVALAADECWSWDFGDGTSSTLQNPTHSFPGPGTYNVCLRVWCCDDPTVFVEVCEVIDVACCETPEPDISWECDGDSIIITALNGGVPADPDIYCWIWEDGTTGGTYTIPLGECSGTYGVCMQMYCCNNGPNNYPFICYDFLVDCCAPCEPLPASDIDFSWGVTTSPLCPDGCSIGFDCPIIDTDLYCVEWDFGDGTTFTDANQCPIHCYTCSGVYDVCLTVYCCDDPTQSTTVCHQVEVQCCTLPSNVDIAVNYIDDCTIEAQLFAPDLACPDDFCWNWDFGDGTVITGGTSAVHTYAAGGVYTVCLEVYCCSDPTQSYTICQQVDVLCGCQLPSSVGIDVLSVTDCTVNLQAFYTDDYTGPLCFEWNMGDGTILTGESVSHTYAASGVYLVCLDVFCCDSPNERITVCQEIQVDCPGDCELPTADFQFDVVPDPNGIDCEVGFCIPPGVLPPGADPMNYCTTWYYGDGTVENHPFAFCPAHTYTCSGVYDVCVDVYCCDDPTNFVTACQQVEVNCCTLPQDVGFTWTYDGDECTISADLLFGIIPCLNDFCYNWDMGDGTILTGQSITYTYATSGVYTVCLNVFCCNDASIGYEICQQVDVLCDDPCPKPCELHPVFIVDELGDCTYLFNNFTVPGMYTTITGYSWDFGDGNTSTAMNPTHSYAGSGTYTVCLTVTGSSPEGNCEATFCWEVNADCFCPSDVNQDGNVNIADLLQVLSDLGNPDCN